MLIIIQCKVHYNVHSTLYYRRYWDIYVPWTYQRLIRRLVRNLVSFLYLLIPLQLVDSSVCILITCTHTNEGHHQSGRIGV